MNFVVFVLSNLNPTNLNTVAERIVTLNIKNEWLLDKVIRYIYNKVSFRKIEYYIRYNILTPNIYIYIIGIE